MKVIKVESDIYKKAEKASKAQGIKTNDFIARALKQGLDALNEKNAEAMLRQRLEDGDLFVWSDGSQPVSMLMKNRPITHTIAISQVFTPFDLRGRGYATAAVHTLTRNLLTAGYRSVNLFTDVTNPTSNHLYQQIGYQPVTEMEKIIFQ